MEYARKLCQVSRKTTFEAAHFLPGYDGKCRSCHGHSFTVELVLEGQVDPETGMVVDFVWMKEILKAVTDKLDHTLLNDTIPNPTAENIATWIKDRVKYDWIEGSGPVKIDCVRIWETPDSYCEVGGNERQ